MLFKRTCSSTADVILKLEMKCLIQQFDVVMLTNRCQVRRDKCVSLRGCIMLELFFVASEYKYKYIFGYSNSANICGAHICYNYIIFAGIHRFGISGLSININIFLGIYLRCLSLRLQEIYLITMFSLESTYFCGMIEAPVVEV